MRQTGKWLGLGYYILLLVFLQLPILLLIAFSFNDSVLLVFPLKGFTLQWYRELLQATELINAAKNSLIIGLVSSVAATVLGSAAAIAIARYNFPGREFFLNIATLPLVIPYVVLAVALLLMFQALNVELSLTTIMIGHTIINMPYVMLIVAARLSGFANNLEEAAMDLGATYWGTLMRVTLPISMPALVAAFLSSFTMSFDEFSLSFFLAGTQNTLPVYLYSQLRFPSRLPLAVTTAAVVIMVSVVILLFSEWLRRIGTGKPSRD
ncbi:MAG TPA: ABC transporter permease [Anaerolineales bacterium]|nr:ABC transporter permease [Anaerolineales bacterium]HRQ92181.1 ABC transporter permease [Anaerolineales bacterium]